jgi:hypothetical protein
VTLHLLCRVREVMYVRYYVHVVHGLGTCCHTEYLGPLTSRDKTQEKPDVAAQGGTENHPKDKSPTLLFCHLPPIRSGVLPVSASAVYHLLASHLLERRAGLVAWRGCPIKVINVNPAHISYQLIRGYETAWFLR